MTALAPALNPSSNRSALGDRVLAWLRSPLGALLMAGCAFWPVWTYVITAWLLPTADPGPPLVAAGLLVWVLFRTLGTRDIGCEPNLRWTLALVAVYTAAYPFVPALARAMMALGILGLLLLRLPGVGTRGTTGIVGMCLLAAPSVDTLTFFAGAPLRAVTAQVAAGWLLLCGTSAKVEGVMVNVAGATYSVDAPCSGVNGLWSGLVAAALLALIHRLSPLRTMGVLAAAVLLCIPANAWRAASLIRFGYGAEAGSPVHTGVGLAAFVAILIALRYVASKLASPEVPAGPAPQRRATPRMTIAFAAVTLTAGLVPLLPAAGRSEGIKETFPGWPTTWLGQTLRPLPKSALDRRFAQISPAPIARFALPNGDELLLRWTDQAGRWAHAAEDCYEGQGFKITPLSPVWRLVEGAPGKALWHRFGADKGFVSYEVSTVIVSASGETYPDPAWWWWRVAGPGATDRGPWWIVTVQSRSG